MDNITSTAWILLAGLGLVALFVVMVSIFFNIPIWIALTLLLALDAMLLIWARFRLKKS